MDENSVAQSAKTYFCCILKSSYYNIQVADERLNILGCICVSAYMCAYAHVYAMCLYVYVYVCLRMFRSTRSTVSVCV